MNITLEQSGVSALVSLKMEKADYQDAVKKELKNIAAKAEMPGFRKGKVPAGLVNKRFGTEVKMNEINRLVGENLQKFIEEKKLSVLGEPMMSEQQQAQDIENQDDFEFKFDIALAPEFKVELTDKDQLTYYDVEVSEEQVDEQVKAFAQQAGHPEEVQEYADRDILRGALAEQDAEGNLLEGGISLDSVSLMPSYFVSDDQKKLFEGAKVNDVITFNPSEAHGETELAALLKLDKEEAAKHTGKFTFQVSSISRFVPAAYDQELFDRVFEPGTVKTEEEMRAKVKELIQSQYNQDADMKFLIDVRKYTEEKVGKLEFPEALLKRFMKLQNADKGEEFVEKNFEKSLEELRWHLIKEQLVEANKVTIDQKDVKEAALQTARIQFAQYGLTNVPEEYLENYANEMLKDRNQTNAFVDRSVNTKLAAALKEVVKLEHKSISFEDFAKFFEAENAE